jgi:hypothetical protein
MPINGDYGDGGVAQTGLNLGSIDSRNTEPPDVGFDPTNPGGGPGSGGGGTTPGTGVGTYTYEIVSENSAVGSAYSASENSSMSISSCVAVLSRKDGFSASRTSSMHIDNSASYAGNFGYSATQTSTIDVVASTASIHTINYLSVGSSSIKTRYCCSIFPVDYGAYVYSNSAMQNTEYESMTVLWALSGNQTLSFVSGTHFGSYQNSSIENSGEKMSGLTSNAGFSGEFVSTGNLRFLWSHIYRNPTTGDGLPTNGASNISQSPTRASYRYVPFQHSVDYSNVVGTPEVTNASNISDDVPALFAVIAYRNNYDAVKGPTAMYQPEDGSGKRFTGGLTGPYTLSNLVYSGLDLLGG